MGDLFTVDAMNLLFVSFGVGIVVGLTGMGGGALMTPALIFLGIPPAAAVSNDLVAAAANKTVGAITHARSGSPNLKLAAWLVAGSVPTAFAGAFIIKAVGGSEEQTQFVKTAIGLALMLTAATYTLRMYLQLRSVTRGSVIGEEDPAIKPIPTLIIGLVGGLLVGITSVGSGSLIMVALLLLYPTLQAVKLVGTDLVQAVPLVLSAAISHVVVHGIDLAIVIPLIIGGSPGTYLGARIANWVSQAVVRRGIVMVLSLTSLAMLDVDPTVVGIVGAAMLILGPIAWGLVRRHHGLPAFEHGPGDNNGFAAGHTDSSSESSRR
ncbi:sulfite exporter TauE/SafE family protein [Nocardioidaceae bacterium SCSIO 66511]|nr:sulfite exporter TauE/SafE family protein [Nocardioidaceae bacterium SCSIO 66511]